LSKAVRTGRCVQNISVKGTSGKNVCNPVRVALLKPFWSNYCFYGLQLMYLRTSHKCP